MTFEHDLESITITVGEPTTQSRIAVAELASSNRCIGAVSSTARGAVHMLLERLSAVMCDDGREPLSAEEHADILAHLAA